MKNQSLLLIDDDKEDQEIFFSALAELSNSAKCFALQDANEALKKLKSENDSPDFIFLDLKMPRMSGEQFLLEIKQNDRLKMIPIIIISHLSNFATVQLTRDLGADHFITKSMSFKELVAELSCLFRIKILKTN